MRNKRVFSLLLAGLVSLSSVTSVCATTTDEQIADMQEQKQAAEAELAQAQSNINSLESKKQELENYLAELNAQYTELTNSVSQLSIQAAQKEDELKEIKKELEAAKEASQKQYEAMKKRIVYMYERGGASMLELLLSSQSLVEFLNRAENISELSEYDRDMLQKYEDLQAEIESQEEKVEEESASINTLLSERAAKQLEVQTLAANTSSDIQSYINQISANQEEASILAAQISSADSSISNLMQQAAAEQAAAQEAETIYDDYGYDSDEDTAVSSGGSADSTAAADDEGEAGGSGYDDYSEPDYTDSGSYDSGQGTYLGNFVLTAYCNCAQCCGTAGNLTASGTVPSAGRTVAMAGVPFGTQLLINGNVYTVEDLGTPYGHVDIYFNSHSEALSFGLQYADVYQLN